MSYELSALANDAFNIMNKVTRMEYDGGKDFWEVDADHPEHPLVPRLRAASTMAMLTDAPPVATNEDGMITMLRNERSANDAMRKFLVKLEDLCASKGMDTNAVQGWDVIKWIEDHIKS